MLVLVSDSSVLIDLERGELLEACFDLPYSLAVPDLLYENELADNMGETLSLLGLRVESLDSDGVILAQEYRARRPALSAADSFALSLAKRNDDWMLLTGDKALRSLANEEEVDCHGCLWVCDELYTHEILTGKQLYGALTTIVTDHRCRLPMGAVNHRLQSWKDG